MQVRSGEGRYHGNIRTDGNTANITYHRQDAEAERYASVVPGSVRGTIQAIARNVAHGRRPTVPRTVG
jgi:hypothetical protein